MEETRGEAVQKGADIFQSVHVTTHGDPKMRGFGVSFESHSPRCKKCNSSE